MTREKKPAANPADKEPPRGLRRWQGRISLSLSAFIMSLAITLINAFYAVQGAEMVVRAPKQVLLYRDGEGADSVLAVTVRTDLINAAGGYGDVLLEAELKPAPGAPAFDYQGLVNPVFTSAAEQKAASCELGARCVGLPGLLIVERSDQVIDMPGGAARAINLSFPIADWNCTTQSSACARFGSFDKAVDAIGRGPLDIRIILHFHADGDREILCRGGRINAEYLRKVGWISLSCDDREVSGEGLF